MWHEVYTTERILKIFKLGAKLQSIERYKVRTPNFRKI